MTAERPALVARSVLFAPGARPDVVAKLLRSEPDAVIIDLEDSVPPGAKERARECAARMGPELAHEGSAAVYVRVNAVDSEHFADDLDALRPGIRGVVVPKIDSAEHVRRVRDALATRALELTIVVGIETVAGVLDARAILSSNGVEAAYFGAEDYVVDLGGVRTVEGFEVLVPRAQVSMAARATGVLAIDQVVGDLRDPVRFATDAALGRSLGYQGKLCIHPDQVAWAHRAFVPSEADIDRASNVLAMYRLAAERGEASIEWDGQLIDEPIARQARAVLARAGKQEEG
jgi:citrate lyase subunit beta/citryl-CoA lyase